MNFKQTLTILEADKPNVRVKALHFTFKAKRPTSNQVWNWIEKQEHVTIEDFKFSEDGKGITIYPYGVQLGDQKKDIQDFTDMFGSKFNATAGKSK